MNSVRFYETLAIWFLYYRSILGIAGNYWLSEQEKQVASSATAMELGAPADTSATAMQPENRDISSLAAHIAENNLKKSKLEKGPFPLRARRFPPFLIICPKNYSRF